MNNEAKKIILIIFFFSIFSPQLFFSLKKKEVEDLPLLHQKWLKEEVVYIITPTEKDIFLSLHSDRERNIFIAAFWKQRDPTRGTTENEFKTEHYRRIAYANKFFGRDTTRPGWMTDRGRIYIILGPPFDTDRHPGTKGVYPAEVWFYAGTNISSLPPAFNIVFLKKRGVGEHKIYSPVSDGPYSLLINYAGNPTDLEETYMELKSRAPDLADYAITLIPGETSLSGHASLISDVLLSNIKTSPHKTVNDNYAKSLLKYKDNIEVEYTANYIQNDYLVKVFQDDSGLFFVHYSVEPENLSVGSLDEKYYANFLFNGNFSNLEGKTIFQYEKNFYLEFSKEQLMDFQGKPFILEDIIPLIPGNYRFSLLVKNTVSKEFSSFEQTIDIPHILETPKMSQILLFYRSESKKESVQSIRPYQLGKFQLYTQPRANFSKSDNLNVFFQIYGLSSKLRREGFIRYTFIRNSSFHSKKDVPLKNYPAGINFMQEFSLAEFLPDYFSLRVSLLDAQENELFFKEDQFVISRLTRVSRPWIYSKVIPSSENVEYNYILGTQYLNQGDLLQAVKFLGAAFAKSPESLTYATAYSQVLFQQERFENVKNILFPFAMETQAKDFSFLMLLGQSLQALKEFEIAIQHYKKYLNSVGTNLLVLNAIGECYFRLGKKEEALIAWEKSLEINPRQQEIQEKVNTIKKLKHSK